MFVIKVELGKIYENEKKKHLILEFTTTYKCQL